MANPVFNDDTMRRDAAGWAAPVRGGHTAPLTTGSPLNAPTNDGPTTPWSKDVMTVNGTITAVASLFVPPLISATFGVSAAGRLSLPPL